MMLVTRCFNDDGADARLPPNCWLGKHPSVHPQCSAKAVKRSNSLIAAKEKKSSRRGWWGDGEDYSFGHVNALGPLANCTGPKCPRGKPGQSFVFLTSSALLFFFFFSPSAS